MMAMARPRILCYVISIWNMIGFLRFFLGKNDLDRFFSTATAGSDGVREKHHGPGRSSSSRSRSSKRLQKGVKCGSRDKGATDKCSCGEKLHSTSITSSHGDDSSNATSAPLEDDGREKNGNPTCFIDVDGAGASHSQHQLTLIHISDTHNLYHLMPPASLPDGDILLHTGDFVDLGSPEEFAAANDWFREVKRVKGYQLILGVSGNHDWRQIGRWDLPDGVMPNDRPEIFQSDTHGHQYNASLLKDKYLPADFFLTAGDAGKKKGGGGEADEDDENLLSSQFLRSGHGAKSWSDSALHDLGARDRAVLTTIANDNDIHKLGGETYQVQEKKRAWVAVSDEARGKAKGNGAKEYLQRLLPEVRLLHDELIEIEFCKKQFAVEVESETSTAAPSSGCSASTKIAKPPDALRVFGFAWSAWQSASSPDKMQTWGACEELLPPPHDSTVEQEVKRKYGKLPEDVDVLLSHPHIHGVVSPHYDKQAVCQKPRTQELLRESRFVAPWTKHEPFAFGYNSHMPAVVADDASLTSGTDCDPPDTGARALTTWSREGVWGSSIHLRDVVNEKRPRVVLSGHVHSGGPDFDQQYLFSGDEILDLLDESLTDTAKRLLMTSNSQYSTGEGRSPSYGGSTRREVHVIASSALKNAPKPTEENFYNENGGWVGAALWGTPTIIRATWETEGRSSRGFVLTGAGQWRFRIDKLAMEQWRARGGFDFQE